MKTKFIEHVLSVLFVSGVLLLILFLVGGKGKAFEGGQSSEIRGLSGLEFVDTGNPFERALLKDAVNIFYPGQYEKNNAAVEEILNAREKKFRDKLQKAHVEETLSWQKAGQLFPMYIKFLLIYVIVMLLTYYGVQTLAVWRFCSAKRKMAPTNTWEQKLWLFAKRAAVGIASFVLFCPAYVIAYSLRTELNTDTLLFMAVLCVISNGLLMVYANKFYTFILSESRKGYVETAMAKNLHNSYSPHEPDGISRKAMLRIFKRFEGHVFGHIFQNAHFQYLSTVKEQASFLITGMIITEMALNLHGYLSYEMLRQMLYRNYDIVIIIMLGIFYAVKATEIFTDYAVYKAAKKYENK